MIIVRNKQQFKSPKKSKYHHFSNNWKEVPKNSKSPFSSVFSCLFAFLPVLSCKQRLLRRFFPLAISSPRGWDTSGHCITRSSHWCLLKSEPCSLARFPVKILHHVGEQHRAMCKWEQVLQKLTSLSRAGKVPNSENPSSDSVDSGWAGVQRNYLFARNS